MRWSLPLGRVRGIPLRLHASFLLVIPLLAPAFGAQLSRALEVKGGSAGWVPLGLFGVLMVLGLFASVLLHELAHALFAISHGGRVRSITLMLIGGVTALEEAPARPRDEAWMALLGPVTSLVLGAALLLVSSLTGGSLGLPLQLGIFTLGAMNLGLGLFNLLPAFPMDGGRVLRALLSPRLGAARATKVAARVGQGFAVLFGVAGLMTGNFLLILIALFVLMGAQGESQQVQVKSVLEQLSIRELLDPPAFALHPDDTLQDALESLTLRHVLALPVVESDGRIRGVLSLQQLRGVSPEARTVERVQAHLQAADPLGPEETAWDGLRRLSAERLPLLPVAESDGRWLGNLSQESLARALQLAAAQDRPPRRGMPGRKRHQPA